MKHLIFVILFLSLSDAFSQDPLRFQDEVNALVEKHGAANRKNLTVFTGSSSVRLWVDLQERFPGKNIINTGFGGSQTSDMIYYSQELVGNFQPQKVFVYEGDNDLGAGKSPKQILSDAEKLTKILSCTLPKQTKIYLITPKPSILRWEKKTMYEEYIAGLKKLFKDSKKVTVIDVWTPMLTETGDLKRDLYLEDNLHMNKKGYDIWTTLIRPYLD
jgi:lysophospholipase L1-like esterase